MTIQAGYNRARLAFALRSVTNGTLLLVRNYRSPNRYCLLKTRCAWLGGAEQPVLVVVVPRSRLAIGRNLRRRRGSGLSVRFYRPTMKGCSGEASHGWWRHRRWSCGSSAGDSTARGGANVYWAAERVALALLLDVGCTVPASLLTHYGER